MFSYSIPKYPTKMVWISVTDENVMHMSDVNIVNNDVREIMGLVYREIGSAGGEAPTE